MPLTSTTSPERIVEELGRLARLPATGAFTTTRWQPETSTVAVSVGTSEQTASGIFHRVAGSLTSQRLEILAADIHTFAAGHVLDHFTVVDHDFAGEPPAERLAEIAAAVRVAIVGDHPPEFARRSCSARWSSSPCPSLSPWTRATRPA
jgi:[protein-PII] uridylyltransferase